MKSILCIAALLAFANAEYPSFGTPAYLNDNNVLQYALTLENLEYSFYTQALTKFNVGAFNAAGISTTAYNFIQVIQGHEMTHVAQLSALLQARGAVPVMPCNYTFAGLLTDVTTFIGLARALEETGVRAYDGAITLLTQTDLITLAGSVATVEARHAAFLNMLNSSAPFPNALDMQNNVSTIFGQAGVFFNGSCTYLTNVTSATYSVSDAFRNVTAYVGSPASANDLNVLQFALTLETLEARFYNLALQNIQPATFAALKVDATALGLLQTIQGHENYHVLFLSTFLKANGVTPVGNCSTYNFDAQLNNSATGVAYFLTTGATLESGGVSAYLGALPYLTSEALIQIAATIVTVEARHASFLASLTNMTLAGLAPQVAGPFPNVEDTVVDPSLILNLVLPQFATGCPAFPALRLADSFRANNTNQASSSSASATSSSSASATTGTASSSATVTGSMTGTRTTSGSTGSGTVTGSVTGSRSSSASRTVITTATAQNSDASTVAVSVAVLAALALVF